MRKGIIGVAVLVVAGFGIAIATGALTLGQAVVEPTEHLSD